QIPFVLSRGRRPESKGAGNTLMAFWVYMLRCRDGSYYVGQLDHPEVRLWQHQQGLCCDWTMRGRPIEPVWFAEVPTRYEALEFERRIKGRTRAKKEALIRGDWDAINLLSRAPGERPSTTRSALRLGRTILGESR